jgi:hypothetical protein
MKKFQENEIKYLAGLLDADGSLSFKFCKTSSGATYLYLILGLSASVNIDVHNYLGTLAERVGSLSLITYEKETYSDARSWRVQSRSDLDQLLPRLMKHMVIKAKHWQTLYETFTKLKGVDVTDQVEELKQFSAESRDNTGPLKPKKHPTWAWVAGYLDGDGCYNFKKNAMHVGAIAHVKDVCALQLLHKAFGGSLYEPQKDNTQLWRHGLGNSQKSFALMFLPNVVKHSRLKKHKIEQMINFHKQPQRLNELNATA